MIKWLQDKPCYRLNKQPVENTEDVKTLAGKPRKQVILRIKWYVFGYKRYF